MGTTSLPRKPEPEKCLVLHIEVPGVYADDLPRHAAYLSEPDAPGPTDYLDVVLEEWMRPEVGLTIVTLPGEKSTNDDFEVHAYTGRIVGAEVHDVDAGPQGGHREQEEKVGG